MPALFANSLRRQALEAMRRVAENRWDLAEAAPPPRRGPLKLAARLFNAMQARLRATVQSLAAESVALSQGAPQLARLASELEQAARHQANRSRDIAAAGRAMAQSVRDIAASTEQAVACSAQVAQTTAQMQQHSRSIGQTMGMIRKVASQTRLLAINAAVEAARAGEHGAGFAVVASEVQALADQTMSAALKVEELLSAIGVGVDQLAQAVGDGAEFGPGQGASAGLHGLLSAIAKAGQDQDAEVNAISRDIEQVAAAAQQQAEAVASVNQLGQMARERADGLLTTLGQFRLEAHHQAARMVEAIAANPEIASMDRRRQEAAMRASIGRGEVFELLYITDARGRQVTDNIAPSGFSAAYGSSGHGRDWSSRPWFKGVAESGRAYVSDIYRSAATDDFCFTVAAPLRGPDGRMIGVLGADVQFAKVLSDAR